MTTYTAPPSYAPTTARDSDQTPIPQVRELNDFSPKPTPEQEAGPLSPGQRRAKADSARLDTTVKLQGDIKAFSDALCGYLEELRLQCATLRNDRGFTERWTVNNLRGAAKCNVLLNDLGEVIRNMGDGHADVNINQGWSIQAITTASSYLFRNVYEMGPRPFVLRKRGTDPNSPKIEKVFTHVLEDLLRKADIESAGHLITNCIPRYGTATWRYEMTRPVKFERDPATNEWTESIGEVTPSLRAWDSRNVYITDPGRPTSADQRGVFWLTPGATIHDLEAEEAVFDIDPAEDAPVPFQIGGKYIGVELMRQLGYDMGDAPMMNMGETDNTARPGFQIKSVTAFRTFTISEFEGAIPLSLFTGTAANPGPFTPDVAFWFGVDVGFFPTPGDDLGYREWVRRVSRVPIYRCSYALLETLGSNVTDLPGNVIGLLQFEPDRHRCPRNTLYGARYLPDGFEFYGQSVVDLGIRLENGGDMIVNSQVWAHHFNAHPARLIDTRIVKSRRLPDAAKLVRQPDALLEATPGMDINKAIQQFFLQIDNKADATRANLKNEFEYTTVVSAAAKGQPGQNGSDTLGEVQINEAKSQVTLNDIAMAYCRENSRMFRNMISDIVFFMGESEFLEYAARVAGIDAGELKNILPHPIDGIEAEFDIQHPLTAVQDTTVLAQIMLRLFQLVGEGGFPDVQLFTRTVLELYGYPRAEVLVQREESMTPADEHMQMRQGHAVQPKQIDDMILHLTEHHAMLEALQPTSGVQFPDMSAAERKNLTFLLANHVQETIRLLQLQMEIAGLATPADPNADPNAAAGQSGPGGEGRGVLDGQGGPEGGGGGNMNAGTDTQSAGMAPLEQGTNVASNSQRQSPGAMGL